ncbi:MAG: hypothetical protein JXA54_06145 [Candidatus Heimdallarchaeota archaeon]|nr:hypothetical protein [Candidatus Heimdallarchaeota archaeon]
MNLVYFLLLLFGIVLLVIISYILIVVFVIIWKVRQPARNNPNNFLKNLKKNQNNDLNKKRIVFIGDSLTNGFLSVNFITMVRKELGDNFNYINSGMNSQVAYNILQRIDTIIQCEPDFIVLLIGTNDAHHEINLYNLNPRKSLKLPQHPSKMFFVESLEKIISELHKKTKAKIALCSLPPIGEDLKTNAFKQSLEYSKIIKELAVENQLVYLPINEKMVTHLKEHSSNPKYPVEHRLIEQLILKHFLIGIKFDKISEKNGFLLLLDHLHLNTQGAKIIADLIIDFVKN